MPVHLNRCIIPIFALPLRSYVLTRSAMSTKFPHTILLLALMPVILLSGCGYGQNASIKRTLDRAAAIMDDRASTAFSELSQINTANLSGKRQTARYALLYTQAQYKCYIDETSDSLINIAVDYYSTKRDTHSKFLSYYYQGCIYMNAGEYAKAALSLSRAELLTESIGNPYLSGLLYSTFGELNELCLDFTKAEGYYSRAYNSYVESGKMLHANYALRDVARSLTNSNDFSKSISILSQVRDWANKNNADALLTDCIQASFVAAMKDKRVSDADSLLGQYLSRASQTETSPYMLSSIAEFQLLKDNPDSAYYYLDKAWKASPSQNDSINLYLLESRLSESLGDYPDAFSKYKKSISLQSNNLSALIAQPVSATQSEYLKAVSSLEAAKAERRRLLLVLTIVASILATCALCAYFRSRHRKAMRAIGESIANIQQLSKEVQERDFRIRELNTQVNQMFCRQFATLDSMCVAFYETPADTKAAQRLYARICSEINGLMCQKNIDQMDVLINNAYSDIMSKIASLRLSEISCNVIRLSLVGYSVKAISVILNETPQNIYQIKSRAIKKVRSIDPALDM